MLVRSKFAGGLAAAALLLASASPAAARGYDGRSHGHQRDGIDAGAVFGLLLGVGVIAAIASANAKKNRQAEARTDYDPRYDDRVYQDDRGYDGRASNDRRYEDGRPGNVSEEEAVDACAVAAREQASRSGGFADIRGITGARAYGNGWDVTGTVDQRASYSATDSRQRSFRCIYENGQVSGVSFGQPA